VHFKQWNLEKAVKTTLFQTRDRPLNDNINLFFFISGLHLEFTDNKSLFLIEIVGFLGAIENTDYALERTLLINND
jgi:hypothetical protein